MGDCKVGRNDPCPCGSSKKFKRCCLDRPGVPKEVLSQLAKGPDRESRFGKVRPIISSDLKGHRVVKVGNHLHFSKKWKTPIDFLFDYVPFTMGKDWWAAQGQLPSEQRSPIFRWAKQSYEFHQTQARDEGDGMYSGIPNGPMHAYLTLAYDLYVLRDNMRFQEEIISHLKRTEHFFGARYELLVAATFIRAGFDIRYENETDNSSKHPEFVATHKLTKIAFDVEAKKRNRGTKIRPEEFDMGNARIGVRDLLASAIGKFRDRPFIVFVDLDVPPIKGDPFSKPWAQELLNTQSDAGDGTLDGKDRCNLVVYTNYPIDYHPDSWPTFSYIPSLSTVPLVPIPVPKPIDDLMDSLGKFGALPTSFDE